MDEITRMLDTIQPASAEAQAAARRWQQQQAKPLGGLGVLEEVLARIAGAQHTANIQTQHKRVLVFCADNGVVAQGVSQCGSEVTLAVTENMARGQTTVCIMAARAGAQVLPVDIGVARPVTGAGILQRAVKRGTGDITKEPAMTRAECLAAMQVGYDLALAAKQDGMHLLATGEMGIGNTTTSAAVASVLLGVSPAILTGRGAGLSDAGLARKIGVIETAIVVNQPDAADPVDVVAKIGGLDIAAMVGVYLGAAKAHLPVLIDGVISAVAALAAVRLCPAVQGYLIATHVSRERASGRVLDALSLTPFLTAGMHLGEGTGAVAAMPLIDMAAAVYAGLPSFGQIGIAAYEPQP